MQMVTGYKWSSLVMFNGIHSHSKTSSNNAFSSQRIHV